MFLGAGLFTFAAGVIVFSGKDPAATRIALGCEVHITDDDIQDLKDAGFNLNILKRPDGGSRNLTRHLTIVIGAWKNPDGGVVYPNLAFGDLLDPHASCIETDNSALKLDAGEFRLLATFRCACTQGSQCLLLDGGAAVRGVTLSPGSFSGSGCIPKSCGPELAGEQGSTWPDECPEL